MKKKLLFFCSTIVLSGTIWYGLNSINTAFLSQKDRENPCPALAEHKAYWLKKGYDGDPLRGLILTEACQPGTIKREIGKAVDKVTAVGDEIVRQINKIAIDVARVITTPIRNKIMNDFYERHSDQHSKDVAQVRLGDNPISEEENKHRQERLPLVKAAQEKFLGVTLTDEETLDISFSLSGGGLRAAIGSLGTLVGADKIGLLNCVMTIGALSGGTWLLFPWLASNQPIQTYRNQFITKWERGIPIFSPMEIKLLIDDGILVPFAFNKDVTPTDLWNAVISTILFSEQGNNRQRITLSSLAGKTDYPVPVGEASWAGLGDERIFEFSPYEIGSRWLKAYIPSWGMGRRYFNGKSENFAPEDAIPLGTFGSAYAAQTKAVADFILKGAPDFIKPLIEEVMQTKVGQLRVGFSSLNNYTIGVESSAIKDSHNIPLADSGAEKILPLLVLYRGPQGKHPDMIFAFDYGGNPPGTELARTVDHAKTHNIPLPNLVTSPEAETNSLTIFADRTPDGKLDLSKPVFLYFPRVNDPKILNKNKLLENFDVEKCINEGPCGTFNFAWSRDDLERFALLTETNIIHNKKAIQDIMLELIKAKKQQKK